MGTDPSTGAQLQWPQMREVGLCPSECWNLVIHTKEFRLFSVDSRELLADLGQGNNNRFPLWKSTSDYFMKSE